MAKIRRAMVGSKKEPCTLTFLKFCINHLASLMFVGSFEEEDLITKAILLTSLLKVFGHYRVMLESLEVSTRESRECEWEI